MFLHRSIVKKMLGLPEKPLKGKRLVCFRIREISTPLSGTQIETLTGSIDGQGMDFNMSAEGGDFVYRLFVSGQRSSKITITRAMLTTT